MESNGKYSIILKESDEKMRAEAKAILDNDELIGEYYICATDEEALKQIAIQHPDVVVYGLIPLKSYIESWRAKLSIELYESQLSDKNDLKKK